MAALLGTVDKSFNIPMGILLALRGITFWMGLYWLDLPYSPGWKQTDFTPQHLYRSFGEPHIHLLLDVFKWELSSSWLSVHSPAFSTILPLSCCSPGNFSVALQFSGTMAVTKHCFEHIYNIRKTRMLNRSCGGLALSWLLRVTCAVEDIRAVSGRSVAL